MKILFLFLDGVGLGANDPDINPFARAVLPNLKSLLQGKTLQYEAAPFVGERATLLALDACLGVEGLPQSATGQATLLTGTNVPAMLGYHYGPKPNLLIAQFLKNGSLFSKLGKNGKQAILINAYPPSYFDAIKSGRRIYSAIPLAVTSAGLSLMSASATRTTRHRSRLHRPGLARTLKPGSHASSNPNPGRHSTGLPR